MSIVDQLTVTQFKFASLEIIGRGDDMTARASMTLLSVNDQVLQRHTVDLTLTTAEKTTLESRIAARLVAFANTTGWMENIDE